HESRDDEEAGGDQCGRQQAREAGHGVLLAQNESEETDGDHDHSKETKRSQQETQLPIAAWYSSESARGSSFLQEVATVGALIQRRIVHHRAAMRALYGGA